MKGKAVEIAELKEMVKKLQEAVEDIRDTGIRESLLYTAIQRSAGLHGHPAKVIPISFIKGTLEGIEYLEGYMFPEEEE